MPQAEATVLTVWTLQRRWSLAAAKAKTTVDWWRRSALLLVSAGATAGAVAASTGWGALAGASAVATGLGAVAATKASGADVRSATRLRAVSEALKAEVFTYLAGAVPYNTTDRKAELDRRVAEVLADADSLRPVVAGVRSDGAAMPAVRDVPTYVTLRLIKQLEGHYRPAAGRMADRSARYRYAQVGLTVLGAAVGGLAAFQVAHLEAWIGALTTAAVAFAVHTTSARHEYLALAYDRTADQLESLRAKWAEGRINDDVVTACESLIAAQNESWLARWNSTEEAE